MMDTEIQPNITDPDIDPIDKLDEICERLKEYAPTVHRPGDPDAEYDYLEPDCACITLNNPFKESRLFIDLNEEFTLTYDNWHTHYYGCMSEYQSLLEGIDEILANRICAATLFTGSDKEWLGSCMVTKDQMEQLEVQEIFAYVFATPEFRKKLEHGGVVEFRFWNRIDDKDVIIDPT